MSVQVKCDGCGATDAAPARNDRHQWLLTIELEYGRFQLGGMVPCHLCEACKTAVWRFLCVPKLLIDTAKGLAPEVERLIFHPEPHR